MKTSRSHLPVYQTLSLSRLLQPGSTDWRSCFPFSAPHGMFTFNGRVALHIGVKSLNLPPGSTVLVPNYFQGVEIGTLLHHGLKLRFYRVNRELQVDLDHAHDLMATDVSAFYVIHYFGFPQDMKAIQRFVATHRLRLIEDCALSLFSRDTRGWLGTYGDISIFSLFKTVAVPHGGYLVSKVPFSYERLKAPPRMSTLSQTTDLIQAHWRAKGWHRFEDRLRRMVSQVGRSILGERKQRVYAGGSTLDPSALGYAASGWMKHLMRYSSPMSTIMIRRRNYALLLDRLRDQARCLFPDLPHDACPLFFPVLVKDKEAAIDRLAARGIGSVNLWRDSHPACPGDLSQEVAYLREQVLELPIHQSLSETDIERVAGEFIALELDPLS